jgi:hypothetical protein
MLVFNLFRGELNMKILIIGKPNLGIMIAEILIKDQIKNK